MTAPTAAEIPASMPAPPPVISPPHQSPPLAAAPQPQSPPAPPIAVPPPSDPQWYLARQVDRHPREIGIQVHYPTEARARGIQGEVKLKIRIDDLGRVLEVEVIEARPAGVFEESARQAYVNGRFEPALRAGRPVRYEAYKWVKFELED